MTTELVNMKRYDNHRLEYKNFKQLLYISNKFSFNIEFILVS